MERAFYLVAYDIPGDRRRQKVARLCEAVAERVQYSLFEAYLIPNELDKLMRKLNKVVDEKEDSLRIYLLCSACQEKVLTRGVGKVTEPPGVRII